MQIIFNPKKMPPELAGKLAIAIGNFDGLHKGHCAIITAAREVAREKGLKTAVITFEPHPLHIFRPEKLPVRLTDMKSKLNLFEELGVEVAIILKFNKKFAQLPAEEFIEKFLRGNHVITGHDFAFGKGRAGSAEMLEEKLGRDYTRLEQLGNGEIVYSSSAIRKALREGDVKNANSLLGRNYQITARVVSGAGKGSAIGFPTANLRLKPAMLRPKYGVYKVITNYGRGVANFGVRPTLDGRTELLEVHIFGFDKKIYGEKLTVEFVDFIRAEKAFNSVEELKEQIGKDCEQAKN